jgi:hypothetical protein
MQILGGLWCGGVGKDKSYTWSEACKSLLEIYAVREGENPSDLILYRHSCDKIIPFSS